MSSDHRIRAWSINDIKILKELNRPVPLLQRVGHIDISLRVAPAIPMHLFRFRKDICFAKILTEDAVQKSRFSGIDLTANDKEERATQPFEILTLIGES